MSHPPYSLRNLVSGEDYQQCGPEFPDKVDCGGTYLYRAEGQRPNRVWADRGVEICSILGCEDSPPQKNGGGWQWEISKSAKLIGGCAQAHSHRPITNVGNRCRGMFLVFS
jgi:hypothetical protein